MVQGPGEGGIAAPVPCSPASLCPGPPTPWARRPLRQTVIKARDAVSSLHYNLDQPEHGC